MNGRAGSGGAGTPGTAVPAPHGRARLAMARRTVGGAPDASGRAQAGVYPNALVGAEMCDLLARDCRAIPPARQAPGPPCATRMDPQGAERASRPMGRRSEGGRGPPALKRRRAQRNGAWSEDVQSRPRLWPRPLFLHCAALAGGTSTHLGLAKSLVMSSENRPRQTSRSFLRPIFSGSGRNGAALKGAQSG